MVLIIAPGLDLHLPAGVPEQVWNIGLGVPLQADEIDVQMRADFQDAQQLEDFLRIIRI